MSDSASWFARRLGGGGGAPTRTQSTPATSTSPPWRAPQVPRPGPHTAVTKDNFHEMAGQWQGGAGTRDATSCPNCGSDKLFSRTQSGCGILNTETGRMAYPAPECWECGYNGRFEQMGNQTGVIGERSW